MKRVFMFCLAVMVAINMAAMPKTTPIDTVNVVCYDLRLDVNYIGLFGMAYIFANNNEYKLTGAILADSIPPGTYTDCMMDLTHIATQEKIPSKSVVLTLGKDANNYATIKGEMLGEDNILYKFDLSWQTPSVQDTVYISFDNTCSVAYYPDLQHDFMLSNADKEFDIAIDIVGVAMGEEFTVRNLNQAYCLITNKESKDTVKIADATGRVWQSHDTTYLTTHVTGFDSVLYAIDLWYVVPRVKDSICLEISQATFYNELESDGYYALVGTTADKSYEFAISLLGDTEEDIPGTYTNNGLFGGFSGENYDFLHFIGGQYTTYIAKWNKQKQDYDIISIEKGQATVTMDDEQNVSLQGAFIGADGVEYKVILDTKVDKPRIQDDAITGEIDRLFTNEKELYIEKQSEDKILLEIKTSTDLLALWFYVDHIDEEIIIPEGEYTIDQSDDYWSVIAADGSLGKTFYATHDGEYFTSLYFLIGGTVVISKKDGKLHFEMNASNSYDVPVHIVYNPTATSVDAVEISKQSAIKKIKNSQLLIYHKDKIYTATGTCIE